MKIENVLPNNFALLPSPHYWHVYNISQIIYVSLHQTLFFMYTVFFNIKSKNQMKMEMRITKKFKHELGKPYFFFIYLNMHEYISILCIYKR